MKKVRKETHVPQSQAMARKSFSEQVVEIACSIPPGRVATYGAISRAAGGGGMAAQSITSILGKAYAGGVRSIPFHRIVYADGRVWINDEHRKKRLALYKKEGIILDKRDRIINFPDIVMEF